MGWFFWHRPDIAVLASGADDVAAMAEIHAASFPRAWSEDEFTSLLDNPGTMAWVAKPAGQGNAPACAFLVLRLAGDEAEIITVATRPAARRSGAGRALMLAALRHAKQEGIGQVLLEVSEGNNAAINLYRALGFRQVGTRKGYYTSHASGQGAGSAPAPAALIMRLDLD